MRNMIVGSDGCLIRTQSQLMTGWEKCDDLRVLQAYAKQLPEEIKEGLKWTGPKLPTELMRKMWATMKQFPHREIGFMLYINVAQSEWFVKCPPQRGSGGGLYMEDKGEGVPAGFALIGSVHTHPGMGAFWSPTDHNDQDAKYGLHFVFGLDDGVPARWVCTICTPRANYDQDINDVVEALPNKDDLGEPPKEWMDILNKPLPQDKREFTFRQPRLAAPSTTGEREVEYGRTSLYPGIRTRNAAEEERLAIVRRYINHLCNQLSDTLMELEGVSMRYQAEISEDILSAIDQSGFEPDETLLAGLHERLDAYEEEYGDNSDDVADTLEFIRNSHDSAFQSELPYEYHRPVELREKA